MQNLETLQKDYQVQIDNAETQMEKNLLKAELSHKVKLMGLGESTDYQKTASESKFECIGCGS